MEQASGSDGASGEPMMVEPDWGEPGELFAMWVDEVVPGESALPTTAMPEDAYMNLMDRIRSIGSVMAHSHSMFFTWVQMSTPEQATRCVKKINSQKICSGKYICQARVTNMGNWPMDEEMENLGSMARHNQWQIQRRIAQNEANFVRGGGRRHQARGRGGGMYGGRGGGL